MQAKTLLPLLTSRSHATGAVMSDARTDVIFDRDVSRCAAQVTPRAGSFSASARPVGDRVQVVTYDGQLESPRAFSLSVSC
ncbi:hypothetical protein [Actinokineospora sp.]|uniref:hypothetical protein n=1 Tax=Actinokineospora sp. TaxID=1872133 RepID=UPI003D6A196E